MNENEKKWLVLSIIVLVLYVIAVSPTLTSTQAIINAVWLAIKALMVFGFVTFLACYP